MSQRDRTQKEYIRKICPKRRSPTRAIREKCLDCMGNQPKEVAACPSTNCSLWAFRMGRNPYYDFSPQGLEAKRKRATEMNAARNKKSGNN